VLVFDDPNTGVRCKIRPDRLIERAGMLVDIKSCRDAAEWAFPRQAENLGYFRKLALYRRGLRAHGWPIQEIAVLAIESEAPYDLAPYLVDPNDIDATDDEVSRLLRLFVTCKETNRWPGYAASEDGFLVLRRPAWAQNGEQRNG
jgi:hypothetical protein